MINGFELSVINVHQGTKEYSYFKFKTELLLCALLCAFL